jgi:hypothetical protein
MLLLRVLYTFAGCIKVAICSVSEGGPSPCSVTLVSALRRVYDFQNLSPILYWYW